MGRKLAGLVAVFTTVIALAVGTVAATSHPQGAQTGQQVLAEDRGPTAIGQ